MTGRNHLRWAQTLEALGVSVVPILPKSKKPTGPWKHLQTTPLKWEQLPEAFERAQLGIITGAISGLVVIDADTPEDVEWAQANLPHTPLATRTSRGMHLFYRHPGGTVPNAVKLAGRALDVRGDGGYVLGPGAIHPSGHVYEAVGEWRSETLEELPVFDSAWLAPEEPPESPPERPQVERQAGPTTPLEDRIEKWLAKAKLDPAVAGQSGDKRTYTVACDLVCGWCLDKDTALERLREFNSVCRPPWPEKDLERFVRSAIKSAKDTPGYLLNAPRRIDLETAGSSGKPQDAPPPDEASLTPAQALVVALRKLLMAHGGRWTGTTSGLWDLVRMCSSAPAFGKLLGASKAEIAAAGIVLTVEIVGTGNERTRRVQLHFSKSADPEGFGSADLPIQKSLDQESADPEGFGSADLPIQKSLDQESADPEGFGSADLPIQKSLDQESADPEPDHPGGDQVGDQVATDSIPDSIPWKSTGPQPANFARTDLGNAEYLLARYGNDLRWCETANRWLTWRTTHWDFDTDGHAKWMANRSVRDRKRASFSLADAEESSKELAWAMKCEATRLRDALLGQAKAFPRFSVATEQLDQHPWLLNCLNGTLDLRTGRLRPHERRNLLSKVIKVNYTATAECPRWESYLEQVMAGDKELIEYLQRCAGYSLTGDCSEQVMFLCWGNGLNGKSIFLEVFASLLEGYAVAPKSDLFTAKPNPGAGANPEVAMLRGSRFVAASESGQGSRLDEAFVKQITGQDRVTARFNYGNFFTFTPTFKVWFATNHKPDIRGTDFGIWRRIRLIPWNVQIPVEQVDKYLGQRLRDEFSGILAWAVRGCLDWQERGLAEPQSVLDALETYREESDTLGQFIRDCCNQEELISDSSSILYSAFSQYCKDVGEHFIPSQKQLARRLQSKGFTKYLDPNTRRSMWRGLRVKHIKKKEEQQPFRPTDEEMAAIDRLLF